MARVHQFKQQQDCADRDGAVGNVKSWKRPGAMVDLDEIRYGTVDHAVVKIACRAAEN